LKNKIAIITGASRGIGREVALQFAREGAKVVVNYLSSEERAHAIAREIKTELDTDAITIKCDVSQINDVYKMIKQTYERFGRIDILVNNAGILIPN